MSKSKESKELARKILMLNSENKKTVINVLNAFVIAETASVLGVSSAELSKLDTK